MRFRLREILKNIFSFKNDTLHQFLNANIRGSKDKLRKKFQSNCESITIRLTFSNLHDEDDIALTNSQLDRLVKAYEEKKGVTISMSKNTISHIMKIEGGFFTGVSRIESIPNRNCLTALGVGT